MTDTTAGSLTDQIKSRERVRDLAEVLTAPEQVKAMLNLVDGVSSVGTPMSYQIRKTYLEPACGNGNFLAEILERKLSTVTSKYGRKGSEQSGRRGPKYDQYAATLFEFYTLWAVSSIYGIDIDAENVEESIARLKAIVTSHVDMTLNRGKPSVARSHGFFESLDRILRANILLGDSLKSKSDITIYQYTWEPRLLVYSVTPWTLDEIEGRNEGKLHFGFQSQPTGYLEPPIWD